MKLFEHSEFEQAMVRAAQRFGVNEQFVEKDYYVTEILRIWGLIARFSEDIDLFVNPDGFDPRPGKNKLDRVLTQLSVTVAEHPALTWLTDEGRTIGGLAARTTSPMTRTSRSFPESGPSSDSNRESRAAPSRPRWCRSPRSSASSCSRREPAIWPMISPVLR
jgi:hypothetical protein